MTSHALGPACGFSPLQIDYIDVRAGELLAPRDEQAERNRIAFVASVQGLVADNRALREIILAQEARIAALEAR